MSITTVAQLKTGADQPPLVYSRTPGTNVWYSPWLVSTGWPQPGVTPSSGVAGNTVDKSTAGSIRFPDAGAGLTGYLASIDIAMAFTGFILVYDRLWHNSGLSTTSTSAQTVGSVALPTRAGTGVGCELWYEQYATMGGAGSGATVTYVNSGGTPGSVGASAAATVSSSVGITFPFWMAAGDIGVQSVTDFTLTSSRVSGTHGLVIRKRIACVPFTGGVSSKLDFMALAMPVIPDDACLEFLYFSSSSASLVTAQIQFAQG